MAYPQMMPDPKSVEEIRYENVLPGYARANPEHGAETSYLPPGFALNSAETFIDGGKKTTKFNSQIISLPLASGPGADLESERIRRARVLLDEAGRMHPNANELVWSWRTIPDSVKMEPNQYRTECLGLHQLQNMMEATNLIGEEMLIKQIDNNVERGAGNDRSAIVEGLWAIYKDKDIPFQDYNPRAGVIQHTTFPHDVSRYGRWAGDLSPKQDLKENVVRIDANLQTADQTQLSSQRMLYQLYLHFLQDEEFDVLATGYRGWVDGQPATSTRWTEMTQKITSTITKNVHTTGSKIATDFISVLAKLDFNMLIGLSADLLKFAIQFTGIAREHSTEFHDMNPVFATQDISTRDATHMYDVYTVGRHKVFPLVAPIKGFVVRTYYWRANRYSFFKSFFHRETSTKSLKSLLHPREYGHVEDVEIVSGEAIYSDQYEGDVPYYTSDKKFMWRQGFPHCELDRLDENPGTLARRADYLGERQASVAMHKSLHSL